MTGQKGEPRMNKVYITKKRGKRFHKRKYCAGLPMDRERMTLRQAVDEHDLTPCEKCVPEDSTLFFAYRALQSIEDDGW